MASERTTITIENAQLIFKNFAGKEGPYTKAGTREFAVLLDDEFAKMFEADGFNVKYLKPREEGDVPQAYLQVAVKFDVKPPRIVMITDTTRTPLDEETCEVLDWADIAFCDLVVSPYAWGPINGKSGIKAYLKSLFVTIAEDDLERKYRINEVEG